MSDSEKTEFLSKTFKRIWTDDELKLIETVKKYPVLYNSVLHSDWELVAMELGVPVEICRGKWVNIRRSYIRNVRAKQSYFEPTCKYLDGTLKFLQESVSMTTSMMLSKCKNSKNSSGDESSVESVPSLSVNADNLVSVSDPTTDEKPTQCQGSSGTTVLTQNIIEYLIKSKSKEEASKKEDDIFHSIASFVGDAKVPITPSIFAMSTGTNMVVSPSHTVKQPNIKKTVDFQTNKEDNNSRLIEVNNEKVGQHNIKMEKESIGAKEIIQTNIKKEDEYYIEIKEEDTYDEEELEVNKTSCDEYEIKIKKEIIDDEEVPKKKKKIDDKYNVDNICHRFFSS